MASKDVLQPLFSPEIRAIPRKSPGFVADILRKGILDGTLPEETSLPPRRASPGIYGASGATVYSAYKILEEEGLVVAVNGAGHYVLKTPQIIVRPERRGRKVVALIVDDIADQIASGELVTGDLLPHAQSLSKMFHTSIGTANRATQELFRKDLVSYKRTTDKDHSRIVIAETAKPDPKRVQRGPFMVGLAGQSTVWERDVRSRGYTSERNGRRTSPQDEERLGPLILGSLRLPRSADLFTYRVAREVTYPRRRMPFDETTYYFPLEQIDLLEVKGPDGTINYNWNGSIILDNGGSETRVLSAAAPTDEQMTVFRIPSEVPLIRIVRTLYSRAKKPLCVSEQLFPGNRGRVVG